MRQFKFIKDYGENKEGDVIDMDMKMYHKFIHPLLMKGVLMVIGRDKIIREKVKEVVNEPSEDEIDFTKELKKWKMGKLRGLGAAYGARDTSKNELIEEIIEKVPFDKIKKYLDEV